MDRREKEIDELIVDVVPFVILARAQLVGRDRSGEDLGETLVGILQSVDGRRDLLVQEVPLLENVNIFERRRRSCR